MVFNPRAGQELAPIPPGMNELFTCAAYNVKLSRWSCGRRYASANTEGANAGVTDRMQFCKGCEVGALHVKSEAAPDVLIQRVVRVKVDPKPIPEMPVKVDKEPDVTIPKLYMYEGKMRPLREIAEMKGMDVSTLHVRIGRWGEKRAFETPYGGPNGTNARVKNDVNEPQPGPGGGTYVRAPRSTPKKLYMFNGVEQTVEQIAPQLGIAPDTLLSRIKKWGPTKALALPRGKWLRKHERETQAAAETPAVVDPPKPETVDEVHRRVAPKARRERAGEVGGKLELPPDPKPALSLGGVACALLEAGGIVVHTVVETGDTFAIFIKKH